MAQNEEKRYRFEIGGSRLELFLFDNQTTNELIMGLKARGILDDDKEHAHTGYLATDETGKRIQIPPSGNNQTIAAAGFVPEILYQLVPDTTVAANK